MSIVFFYDQDFLKTTDGPTEMLTLLKHIVSISYNSDTSVVSVITMDGRVISFQSNEEKYAQIAKKCGTSTCCSACKSKN